MQSVKVRAARFSILSNCLLVVLKLAVGLLTGSVAVLAEALHSASDLLAAFFAYLAVRAADAPPDELHPYGHGKFEAVSGLGEAVLILLAGTYVAYEAVHSLWTGHRATSPPLGMAVMALSAVVNFFVARYLHRVARATDSIALAADAHHLSVDVVTSVGVFFGLLLVALTGEAFFDPVVALIVALLILHTGWQISKTAFAPLLDTRLPDSEVAQVEAVLKNNPQVLSYHKLRTRRSGSERHVDVHIQVDDDMSLREAHALTEALEDEMRRLLPNLEVIIHPEPYEEEMRHQQEVPHRRV